jgi:hypothetical protein
LPVKFCAPANSTIEYMKWVTLELTYVDL